MKIFLFFVLSISLHSCTNTEMRKVENFVVFAHTYGLVRWFHPSDEAQEIAGNNIFK
jgi:hypothetical protein